MLFFLTKKRSHNKFPRKRGGKAFFVLGGNRKKTPGIEGISDAAARNLEEDRPRL